MNPQQMKSEGTQTADEVEQKLATIQRDLSRLPDFIHTRLAYEVSPFDRNAKRGPDNTYHLEAFVYPGCAESSRYRHTHTLRNPALLQRPALLIKVSDDEIREDLHYIMVGADLPIGHRLYVDANLIAFEASLLGMKGSNFLTWYRGMKAKYLGLAYRITTPWGDAALDLESRWFPADQLPLIDDGTLSCRVIALLSTGDQIFLRATPEGKWINDAGSAYDNVRWWTIPPEALLAPS